MDVVFVDTAKSDNKPSGYDQKTPVREFKVNSIGVVIPSRDYGKPLHRFYKSSHVGYFYGGQSSTRVRLSLAGNLVAKNPSRWKIARLPM